MKQVKLYTLKEDIVMSFKDKIDVVTHMSMNAFNSPTYRCVGDSEVIIQTPKLNIDHLPIKEFVKYTKDGREVCYIAIHPDIENLLGVTELNRIISSDKKHIKTLEEQVSITHNYSRDLEDKLINITRSVGEANSILKELEFENTEIKQVLSKLKFLNFWQRVIFLFTNKLPKVD